MMSSVEKRESRIEDPELYGLIDEEERRQEKSINLIASENYAHVGVKEACGSCLMNKYSEGRVGERYYGGTALIDSLEYLCQKRALELFDLDENEWGVNVQAYSGSPANFAVYTGLITPGDRIMGLDLPSGGHLTHGYQTKNKKISASSVYFNSRSYSVDDDGLIDYQRLEESFMEFLPHILICGYSAYSRDIDYEKMKSISDRNDSYLLADISHIAPLIASKMMNNPFDHCDVVTTTTHKGLRGARGALIFYRRNVVKNGISVDLDMKINFAVFPMLQGGPHNHSIAGISFALKYAKSPEFIEYSRKVIENARVLCSYLQGLGFDIMTGGTDNHMILVNLRNKNVSGVIVEHMCDILDINLNRNAIVGDRSPLKPSGIRIGTYAMSTRGFGVDEMKEIGSMIGMIVDLSRTISGDDMNISKNEFEKRICDGGWITSAMVIEIKDTVRNLTRRFPIPK